MRATSVLQATVTTCGESAVLHWPTEVLFQRSKAMVACHKTCCGIQAYPQHQARAVGCGSMAQVVPTPELMKPNM